MEQRKKKEDEKKMSRQLKLVSILFLFVVFFLVIFLVIKVIFDLNRIRSNHIVAASDNKELNEIKKNKKEVEQDSKRHPGEKVKIVEKKEEEQQEKAKKKEAKTSNKKRKKRKKGREKKKETLIIGDSIAFGMSLDKKYVGASKAKDYYWITEGGVGVGFISKKLEIVTGRTMPRSVHNTLTSNSKIDLAKEIKNKEIKNVAVLLGINSSGKKNAENLIESMLLIEEKTGCNVFFIAVLPMVDSKAEKNGYRTRDSVNKQFNLWVKEKMKDTNLVYVDSYNEVKKIPKFDTYTGDGIHYSRKVYDEVISLLEKEIKKKEEEKKEAEE